MAPPNDDAGNDEDRDAPEDSGESLRNKVMVGLTAVFVLLYVAALLGVITPLTDDAVVLRLEPIVAVIIGYYFGRVPGEKNERTLKQEIGRQAKKAKEAEQKKEKAQLEKADMERLSAELSQKVLGAQKVLSAHAGPSLEASAPFGVQGDDPGITRSRAGDPVAYKAPPASDEARREAMAAALRVLDA